jgi:sugar lactone lactonase YvrE
MLTSRPDERSGETRTMHRWLSWAGTVAAGTMALGGPTGCGGASSTEGLGGGGNPDAAGGGGDAGGGPVLPAGVVATLDDQPIALSVIGNQVYVALFIDGIVSVPTSGGTVTSLVPSVTGYTPLGVYFQNAFVFDRTNLYFSESSGGYTSGAIAFAPIGGGTPTVLASSLGFTAGIASDASNVYWVDQDQGTISRVPLGGGSATVLASGLKTPGGLALQNGTLYLTDAAGDLLAVPASGGSVTTMLTGPGLPPNTELADYSPTVVTDASNVYFSVCSQGGATTPALYRVPLGNGGPPTVLASSCAGGIAVDADTVYWTTSDNTISAVPIAGGATRVVATSSQGISGGPAVDDENVYWGVTPQLGSCGLCPPPPQGQVNAIMRAPKGIE